MAEIFEKNDLDYFDESVKFSKMHVEQIIEYFYLSMTLINAVEGYKHIVKSRPFLSEIKENTVESLLNDILGASTLVNA